jgi:hypothetical protein
VPTVAILPGGETVPFAVSLRILPPVTAEVDAFDWTRLGAAPVALLPAVTNRDDCPLSGRLVIKASDGFAVTPASFEFGNLAPGARRPFAATLVGTRQPAAGDRIELTVTSADGASTALTRSLSPTVLDRDRDGLADGWRLNAENTGTLAERNQAVATIETGDREFFCQRVHCQRFTSGWIILHRDRQDRITKGRRYRVTCRARQAGLAGTVGVGVFSLQPWLNCGIENHFRLGPQWQDVAQEFVATTDSDNVRFEFYFTETGTLWIEGMRLAEVAAR